MSLIQSTNNVSTSATKNSLVQTYLQQINNDLNVRGQSISQNTPGANFVTNSNQQKEQQKKGIRSTTLGGTEAKLSTASTGGQREIRCTNCDGVIFSEMAARKSNYYGSQGQRWGNFVTFNNFDFDTKQRVSKSTALKICGACQNKKTRKDPTDDSAKYQQAAGIAQSLAPQIEQEEAKLQPPGGNRYTVIAGSEVVEVGLGINDATPYRVDEGGVYRNWGIADGSKSPFGQADPKYSFRVPRGAPANHVQGLNVPSSPGGHYVVKCSNKFSVLCGAQGIEFNTQGPITFNGGITRIIGPEVSVGSSVGKLHMEGDFISMLGKSIEMKPTDGHVITRGTMSTTGNMMVGGHTHSESASIVKLATTGRNNDTRVSSSSNVYGGSAFYGGPNTEGYTAALKETVAHNFAAGFNPMIFREAGVQTSRWSKTNNDNVSNLNYMSQLGENSCAVNGTGYIPAGARVEITGTFPCNYGGAAVGTCIGTIVGAVKVLNYPHIHAMPDQPHTHSYRGPDINDQADTAEQLRGTTAAGVAGPAPLHVQEGQNSVNIFQQFWGPLQNSASRVLELLSGSIYK